MEKHTKLSSSLWVGITVGDDEEMDLLQFASVPFAYEAEVCNKLGSLTESDILTNDYTPTWGNISGIPSDIKNGDHHAGNLCAKRGKDYYLDGSTTCRKVVDTTLSESQIHTMISDNYAAKSHTTAWSSITGVPVGLNDGDQNTNAATVCKPKGNYYYLDGTGNCRKAAFDPNGNRTGNARVTGNLTITETATTGSVILKSAGGYSDRGECTKENEGS